MASEQVVCKTFEFILQADFIEFESGRLQEALFEIVQVEHDHPAAE